MPDHSRSIWLALSTDRSGAVQIFGAFTVRGLAEQRLRLAQEERLAAQGWQVLPGSTFFVEEIGLADRLTDDSIGPPVRLSANSGAFSSDGR